MLSPNKRQNQSAIPGDATGLCLEKGGTGVLEAIAEGALVESIEPAKISPIIRLVWPIECSLPGPVLAADDVRPPGSNWLGGSFAEVTWRLYKE